MTEREERLLRVEERSVKRIKRRKVLALIAAGFGRTERAERWQQLAEEASDLADRAWAARIYDGTRRWQADDKAQVLRVVEG